MDDLDALSDLHNSQKKWRLVSKLCFVFIVLISTLVFVIYPRDVSGFLIQILMILSMLSIIGLVFLDRVSYQLNKKFFKQDLLHEYLLKHSKPEDIHKDTDIIVELIKDRRSVSQKKKQI